MATTQEFDAELGRLSEEIAGKKALLLVACGGVKAALLEFVKTWYVEAAKEHVTHKPEVTKNLGAEQLALMKQKVQQLVEMSSESVETELRDESIWFPKRTQGDAYTHKYHFQHNSVLYSDFRRVTDRLGKVLQEYGYMRPRRVNGNDVYDLHIAWPATIQTAVNQYGQLFSEYVDLEAKEEKVKRQKAEYEATSMWDSV